MSNFLSLVFPLITHSIIIKFTLISIKIGSLIPISNLIIIPFHYLIPEFILITPISIRFLLTIPTLFMNFTLINFIFLLISIQFLTIIPISLSYIIPISSKFLLPSLKSNFPVNYSTLINFKFLLPSFKPNPLIHSLFTLTNSSTIKFPIINYPIPKLFNSLLTPSSPITRSTTRNQSIYPTIHSNYSTPNSSYFPPLSPSIPTHLYSITPPITT